MKKLFRISVICALLSVNCAAYGAGYRAALVADMDTGRVLYQENATDLNYPASLTKIMTLYLTFDALEHGRLHLDDHLIVSESAAAASPVKLGLKAGSKIKVEDAIKAVAVHSANDVARVLAENLKGGKEGNFAFLMTRVATEIGLSKTNFENSSGLPNDDQLSCARDIALLSMAVYKHFPQYWKYFGIKTWTYDGKTYANGNRLLNSYPGCDGMKTGYTNKSKYSLVAAAKQGDKRLMSVVLGAENKDIRAAVSTRMLDKGFAIAGGRAVAPTPVAPTQVEKRRAQSAVEKSQGDFSSNHESQITNHGIAGGAAGVQFGAFSSQSAAQTQVANVMNKLGVRANIEPTGTGMYRVRANGLSETAAQRIRGDASASSIDSYVFH
ncbi:MAG: D-alanyl-D-alanine carboxypeptidase [Rickettsiales bacterium]|jgi:D-alanyl-D-alanine carboxypeptidase|nr:D-alanyl-D-alanine carboxypeptidase [Rickettsiales bacterium]